jgi:hypothetical protein
MSCTFMRLLSIVTMMAATVSGFAADPVPAPPNVLLLFADDQRADTIAAWGNRHIKTPNLDKLVERGFSFRNNYCFGSNSGAVCVPSRAMLMSGRTWFDVKPNLAGATMLPEVLRERGYTRPSPRASGTTASRRSCGHFPMPVRSSSAEWTTTRRPPSPT